MTLDGHSGIIESDGNGSYKYRPANTQYPDQGDFAFRGPDAFDAAVTRAYPHGLSRIHALEVVEGKVVEPYPEDMPGVVYVENGSIVRAQKVPAEIVEEHIDRINAHQEPLTSQEVMARMSHQMGSQQ